MSSGPTKTKETPEKTDNENKKAKEKEQKNGKDGLDNEDSNDTYIETPSFIRLFVMRRIISEYIKNQTASNDKKKEIKEIMQELVNDAFKDDQETQSLAVNILTRLMEDGIKDYMAKWYNEEKEAIVIEEIFNKVILEKFSQEYNKYITYKTPKVEENNNNKRNNYFYQDLVFNSRDLMSKIFQHLHFEQWFYTGDLIQCSLVNSYWLYHSWNKNSIYYINCLDKLCEKTLKYEENKDNSNNEENNEENEKKKKDKQWKLKRVTRVWQRLIHLKWLDLLWDVGDVNPENDPLVLKKLSMLRKVENVKINMYGSSKNPIVYEKALQAIMDKCKERVKYCRINLGYTRKFGENSIPPINIPNARLIEIGDIFFYRIWSNKCEELIFHRTQNISKTWCEYVIKNCQFSNIKKLTLNSMRFDEKNTNDTILKKFAKQFINLEEFIIIFNSYIGENVPLFWQLLLKDLEIISKNNIKCEIDVREFRPIEIDTLKKIINKRDLAKTISKLVIESYHYDFIDEVLALIQEIDGHGLKHLVIGRRVYDQSKKILNEISFKSIRILEYRGLTHYLGFDNVNDFLQWNIKFSSGNSSGNSSSNDDIDNKDSDDNDDDDEKRLFVIVDGGVNHYNYEHDTKKFLTLFKQLCENIVELCNQQIPFDIKLKFKGVQARDTRKFQTYLPVYLSYFENNKEFFQQYNKPKGIRDNDDNDSFIPRDTPYTYFCVENEIRKVNKHFILRATNVFY